MQKKIKSKTHQSGFTIVELLIATTVFSVVLLVISSGIIQIGRKYYKNITSSRTQEVTRSVTDEISRSAQFSDNFTEPTRAGDKQIMCIGNTRYVFMTDTQIKEPNNRHALWAEPMNGTCVNIGATYDFNSDKPSPDGRELLGENMRLLDLNVQQNNGKFTVKVAVAYGDSDLLTTYNDNGTKISGSPDADALCKSGIAGSSFCSVSVLEVTVDKR